MLNRYYPGINDPHSAWKNHINTQGSLDEISLSLKKQYTQSKKESTVLNATINQAKSEYIDAISNMSGDISSSIDYCAERICGSLDQGFDLLSNDINELGRSLDIRLSLILEQEVVNNLISENIALLLRIPDIQKERQYYLEQGLKHLKNSFIDKDFYENALENLLEAEKREKTDYVTLHHIGMIYLYSAKYLDLPKAEDYFRRAGKFAKIESDPQAMRLANIMTGNVLIKLAENVPGIDKMRYVSAESYLQGAIACYIQQKYNESSELSQIAFNLAPELLEAGFYACLSNALEGNSDQTLKLLETLVNKNPKYAVIAATDPILAPKNYVKDWLTKLRQDTLIKAQKKAEVIKSKILNNSKFYSDLNEAQTQLIKASYVDTLKIISYLNFELPISEEISVYNQNLKNVESLRTVIHANNENTENLKRNSELVIHLEDIDITDINKTENLLVKVNPSDQWAFSSEIFSLGQKTERIVRENLSVIISKHSEFVEQELSVKQHRKEKADNIDGVKGVVKIIGWVMSFVLGFTGCYRSPVSYLDTGNPFSGFSYFISYFLIGFGITYLIIWLMSSTAIRLRDGEKSKREIEINNKAKKLSKYVTKYNELLNTLLKIEIIPFSVRYIPFIKYFKN